MCNFFNALKKTLMKWKINNNCPENWKVSETSNDYFKFLKTEQCLSIN